MYLSKQLQEAAEAKGFSLKQKEGEDYWYVHKGGKKVGAVSKDDEGKFDGTREGAPEGKGYKQGFDTKEAAAAWVAG